MLKSRQSDLVLIGPIGPSTMPTVDVDVYILGDHVDDTGACVRSIQAGLMQSRADAKPVTGNHGKVMMVSV